MKKLALQINDEAGEQMIGLYNDTPAAASVAACLGLLNRIFNQLN